MCIVKVLPCVLLKVCSVYCTRCAVGIVHDVQYVLYTFHKLNIVNKDDFNIKYIITARLSLNVDMSVCVCLQTL